MARIININDYSKLAKLLAVTAYMLRFINNTRRAPPITADTHLSPTELAVATVKWIHAIQHDHFPVEIQNLQAQSQRLPLVRQLRLLLDKEMLLHCGGQIYNAPLSELAKFPYLLPSRHHFTNLVILQAHAQLHHSGVNATVSPARKLQVNLMPLQTPHH